jgi:hypothetical protein
MPCASRLVLTLFRSNVGAKQVLTGPSQRIPPAPGTVAVLVRHLSTCKKLQFSDRLPNDVIPSTLSRDGNLEEGMASAVVTRHVGHFAVEAGEAVLVDPNKPEKRLETGKRGSPVLRISRFQ